MLTATVASPPTSGGISSNTSTTVSRGQLTEHVQDALRRRCKEFDCSTCCLEMENNLACLHGSVESVAQKRAIDRAALSVPGVFDILDDLRVAPLSCHSDQRIAAEVRQALIKAGLSSPLPEMKVVDRVVCLLGTVGSTEARKIAEDAAWSVPAVEYVLNDTTAVVTAPCPKQPGQEEKLRRDVQLAMERSLGIEARNVRAEMRGEVVYLSQSSPKVGAENTYGMEEISFGAKCAVLATGRERRLADRGLVAGGRSG